MLKKNVLRNQKDFDAVYRKGKSAANRYIVIFYRKNRLGYTRTGYLASKKIGNSVMRNRARRLMKEAFRTSGLTLPDGYDFVIIARKPITEAKCQDVRKSLNSVLKRTGVMEK
ncbi:MAG: ribonuclease P protein component [Anaerovoracaceae bacterium]|jgi:ribonuclease P protein component